MSVQANPYPLRLEKILYGKNPHPGEAGAEIYQYAAVHCGGELPEAV